MYWFCDSCRKFRRVFFDKWNTGPGTSRCGNFCRECLKSHVDFHKSLGIDHELKEEGATFVRFVGSPRRTSGENAFGSVLAEYSDGSTLGVNCGHGGSEWLCLRCAERLKEKEHEK